MQNALKGAILQVTIENSNVNAAMLQALQCTTVATAVDRLVVVQNSQNNDITTVYNIMCNYSTKFKFYVLNLNWHI